MGKHIRSLDWSQTPLGSAEEWPQSLCSIYWGRDLGVLYNDDWSPILGEKHPWALGRPAREAWPEIWDIICPLFERVQSTGEATRSRDQLLPMYRHGFTEECYFDYTFSPIRGEGGTVDGVFNAVIETTNRVIGERRLSTLRDLAAWRTGEARSVEDACRIAAQVLSEDPHDLPFALLYLLDADGRQATLAGQTGLDQNSPACPAAVDLDAQDAPWPFRQVAEAGKPEEVADLLARFGSLPCGIWPEPPQRAVVLPMARSGQTRLAGFVVAAVSPRLALNDEYKGFLDLLAGHIAAAVSNARAYEEERRRAEALAELDRAKTAFFSNVSHEFRTPLTLLLGPVEDMLAKPESGVLPENRQLLALVHRSALRLQKLVNTLLDFSRIEAGRVQAVFEPTDLGPWTGELASNFRSACDKAGLRLLVDCPPLTEPVYVDRDMWEKVVLNLLSNAFKFTFAGEIAVALRQFGQCAVLTVRDTGTGIPADQMPYVFERFHQVDGVHGRTQEGSGIGLALVRELVRLHGGEVQAESEVGRGSTFTVSIPLGASHLPADRIGAVRTVGSTALGAAPYVEEALRWLPLVSPPPAERTFHSSSGRRPRVLLADDNADMREYVRRLLSDQYDLEVTANGRMALEAARQAPPDLILADVMMPGLDGFGLLRELRADERTQSLPVLLLSARAGEEARVEGLRAGADDYLTKPFSARELLARVEAHLQMARTRQQAEQAVRESEERFRSIFDQTIAGIAQTDLTGRFTQVNGRFCAIVGRSAEELYGLRMPDITHPDDLSTDLDLFRRLVQGSGEPFVIEKRYVRPDGSHVWVSNSVSLVRDRHGEPRHSVSVSLDVTDRRRTSEALRQREQHMRAVVETSPECVKLVAPEGTLLEMNPAGLTMVEADTWESVARKSVYCLIAPEYQEQFRAFHERVCGGEKGTLEFEIAGLRGGRRAVETHAVPLRMADGQLVHLAITRDISERKRREHALRRLVECGRATGPLFFESLVRTLAEVLGVRYAFIGELPPDNPGQARTLAVWADGRRAENFAYELSGTPCENVVEERTCFYHSGVMALFPGDRLLAEMGVDSYLGTPLRGSDGTTLGLLVVLHDGPIDEALQPEAILELSAGRVAAELERQRGEQALRESERKLRLIAENTTDTVFAYDMSRRLLYVNPAFEKLTGYSSAMLYASQPIDYLHPQDAPRMRELIDDAFQGKAFDGVEFRIVTRGGQVKWCLSSWGPLRDGNGVQVGVQGREHDVTERKRAEQERAELLAREQAARAEAEIAQRRYRELVDGLDAIVWEADARTWQFTFVSRRAEQLLGYPAERWLNESGFWLNLIHPEDRERAVELCSIACAECRDHDFEYRAVAADGRVVWLRDIVYVVKGADGGATHLRGVMVDITRTKELEAALQQRAVELAEADRRKDEFLATLAHELRNPLAPICNALQIIGLAGDNLALMSQARCMMERQLTQMVRLIDDLLDVSRITRNKLELRHESVELAVAVQCAVDTARPLIEAAQHRLTITLPQEPVLLHADLIRLAQVFSNLLTNAAKYTERGGEISLTAERQGGDLVVRVKDTGVGIPCDKLAHVFDLFVQVDRSLERSQGGLGIGLTLVKRLVELHGGSVAASSDGPGKGSVFTVRLPLPREAAVRQSQLPDGGTTSRLGRCRILVVDDNKDSAESLALMLRLRGAEVRTAYDGLEAVQGAGQFQPNVILLDIGMPKLNGYDAARRIRAQSWSNGTLLIAMTGWGQEEDKRRAAEAGFDHHLTKPIEHAALEKALAARAARAGN
jgi:PAS domain S-box-containing protein